MSMTRADKFRSEGSLSEQISCIRILSIEDTYSMVDKHSIMPGC